MPVTFDEIWRANGGALQAFLRARVAQGDADDILQETAIRAFRGLGQLEDPAKARAWLFQIARRTTADFYRKRNAAKPVHPDDVWPTEDEQDPAPDLAPCVAPLLASLPGDARRALSATDLAGQSQRRFAEAEGLQYPAAKSRVQRARSALRRAFEACCELRLDRRGTVADCRYRAGVSKKC